MAAEPPDPGFEARVSESPPVTLYAERLRDGRVALGSRLGRENGGWDPGEMHLLAPGAYLALAGWLSAPVEEAWLQTVRHRQAEPMQTALELYGEGSGAVERLAMEMVEAIPRSLVARAMILLANSIGPEARDRLVARLNETRDISEEAALRRRLADQDEAFAYVVAAAALFDALGRGLPERADDEEG